MASSNRYGAFAQDLNLMISSYKTPQRVEEVPRAEFAAAIPSNPAPVKNPLGTKFTLSKLQGASIPFSMTLAPVPADMAAPASAKGKAGKETKAGKAPTKKKEEKEEKEVYVSGSSDNEMSVSDSFIDKDYKGEDDDVPFANAFVKTKHFSESRFKKKHAATEAAIRAGEFRSDDSSEDDDENGDDVVDASDEDEDEDEDEKHEKNEKDLFKGKKIEYEKKDFVKLPDYDVEFRKLMKKKKGKIIETFDSDSGEQVAPEDLSSSEESSEDSSDPSDPMDVDSPNSNSSPLVEPDEKQTKRKKKDKKMIDEDLDDITTYARHILAAPLPKHVRRKPADERRAPTQRAKQAALAGKEILPSLVLPGEVDEEASTTDNNNNRQAAASEDADHFPRGEDEESDEDDEEDGANTDRISRAQGNILANMERIIGDFSVDGNPLGDIEVDKHVNAVFNLSHLLMNAFAEQQAAKNIQRSIDQGRTLVANNSGSRKQREAVQESLRFLTEFTHTPLMLEIVTVALNK
jgi:hypothetical protein